MSQYSFPLLNNADIIQTLADLEITLTDDTLNKPTYEIVRPVFEALVQSFVGVSREELEQPVFSATEALEFPELYDESIPAMAFLRHLNRLMRATGIGDFSIRDLYKPDPARLRRQLSAVINFGKYREEKLALLTSFIERAERANSRRAELETSMNRLAEEQAALRAARAAEEPDAARMEAEIEGLFRTIQALHAEQDQLQQEVRGLKGVHNELSDRAASRKLEVAKKREEGAELRNQLVTSPEKLQRVLRELEENTVREQHATVAAEKRGRDLAARADATVRLEKDLERAQRLLEEVEETIVRKKDSGRTVKELRARIEAGEGEVVTLTTQCQHLRRQKEAVVDRIMRLEQQGELKREAVASHVQQHLAEKEAIEAEKAASLLRMQENEIQSRALSDRVRQLAAAHDAQMTAMHTKYRQLRDKVKEYHGGLLQTMKMPAPVMNVAAKMST